MIKVIISVLIVFTSMIYMYSEISADVKIETSTFESTCFLFMEQAEKSKYKIEHSDRYDKPAVTEILPKKKLSGLKITTRIII